MTKSHDWLWIIIITSSLFASAGDDDTVFNGFVDANNLLICDSDQKRELSSSGG